MRLTDASNKIKSSLGRLANGPDLPKDLFAILLILLVGTGGFLLGRLSAAESVRKEQLSITGGPVFQASAAQALPLTTTNSSAVEKTSVLGMYVGSRTGKTYHLPWCSGAKRIKEENKVWFQTKDEAEGRGYRAAANCNGI